MFKLLRLTSIIIAGLAVIFTGFVAVKGISSDEKMEALIATAGIAEQLQSNYSGRKGSDFDRQSPLMKQAAAFANRIDPPPPPQMAVTKTVTRQRTAPGRPRPQAAVSAKFKLVGTSCNIAEPAESWALINEVGKGWHWVKLGELVGHLKIEKIGKGVILINDNGRTYELAAERVAKPDYVTEYSGGTLQSWANEIWSGDDTAQKVSQVQSTIPVAETSAAAAAEPVVTAENVQSNIDFIKSLKDDPAALGLSPDEAKELEGLGDILKSLEADLEQIEQIEQADANDQAEKLVEPENPVEKLRRRPVPRRRTTRK